MVLMSRSFISTSLIRHFCLFFSRKGQNLLQKKKLITLTNILTLLRSQDHYRTSKKRKRQENQFILILPSKTLIRDKHAHPILMYGTKMFKVTSGPGFGSPEALHY
jgi:hypothetical protein